MIKGGRRRHELAALPAACLVLLAVIGLAACGDDEAPVASATVPTAAPSPADPAPAADDESLTVEEVQSVLDELDAIHGEAAREALGARELTDRFHELHAAVFGGEELEAAENQWREQVKAGFPAFVDEPGDPVTRVVQVLTATKDCVLVATDRDFRPFLGDGVAGSLRYFLALEAVGEDGAWRITMDARTADDQPPAEERNPCA